MTNKQIITKLESLVEHWAVCSSCGENDWDVGLNQAYDNATNSVEKLIKEIQNSADKDWWDEVRCQQDKYPNAYQKAMKKHFA